MKAHASELFRDELADEDPQKRDPKQLIGLISAKADAYFQLVVNQIGRYARYRDLHWIPEIPPLEVQTSHEARSPMRLAEAAPQLDRDFEVTPVAQRTVAPRQNLVVTKVAREPEPVSVVQATPSQANGCIVQRSLIGMMNSPVGTIPRVDRLESEKFPSSVKLVIPILIGSRRLTPQDLPR